MSSDLVSSTSYIKKPAVNAEEYDRLGKKYAEKNIRGYNVIGTFEQICDEQDLIVEELLLVQGSSGYAINFSMRIVELRSVDSLYASIREAEMLKILGFHKNLMGLFSLFRHRQYVAFVFPDFTCIRDRLDSCIRFNSEGSSTSHHSKRHLSKQKNRKISNQPGLFDRNSVAYLLREVIEGVSYIHSKGYIHSQICTANIYMSNASDVKLGGFLHCKRIGSRNWEFAGNPDCYPPETFVQNLNGVSPVGTNFDTWSIGILALECITGQVWHYPSDQIQSVMEELISRKLLPPTSLGEIDPKTLHDGKQVYHKDIDNFLQQSIRVNTNERIDFENLHRHPFLSEEINVFEAKEDWQAYPPRLVELEKGRSLHAEMIGAHCEASELNNSFLLNVVKAVKLAEKQCFPIVKKVPDSQFLNEFVGIAAFLLVRRMDDDWSRDVLDQSRTSSNDYLKDYMGNESLPIGCTLQTPRKSRGTSLPGDNFRRTITPRKIDLEKLQRNEMVFFVSKTWNMETRQVFIALQFARWYLANLLRFSDLLRIVDEIEDIIKEYAGSESLLDTVPGSASFITGLRKSHLDQDNRRFNHVHVEVALRSQVISDLKKKFDHLQEGDPVKLGEEKTTLQTAATYRELDVGRMEFLESVMMGHQRVDGWAYHPESRFDDALEAHAQLRGLLEERRNNPLKKFTNYKDSQASNQARTAKIWGDFDRDFLFRFCKFAVPSKLTEGDASRVFCGHNLFSKTMEGKSMEEQLEEYQQIVRFDDIEKQLMITRAKQEQDIIFPFKRHDDVEARQSAVEKLLELEKNHELRLNRLETLVQQIQDQTFGFDLMSPGPNSSSGFQRKTQGHK